MNASRAGRIASKWLTRQLPLYASTIVRQEFEIMGMNSAALGRAIVVFAGWRRTLFMDSTLSTADNYGRGGSWSLARWHLPVGVFLAVGLAGRLDIRAGSVRDACRRNG